MKISLDSKKGLVKVWGHILSSDTTLIQINSINRPCYWVEYRKDAEWVLGALKNEDDAHVVISLRFRFGTLDNCMIVPNQGYSEHGDFGVLKTLISEFSPDCQGKYDWGILEYGYDQKAKFHFVGLSFLNGDAKR